MPNEMDLDARLAGIESKMSEQTTVVDSTAALVDGLQDITKALRQEVADLKAGGGGGGGQISQAVMDRLDALDAALSSHKDKLTKAAEENLDE